MSVWDDFAHLAGEQTGESSAIDQGVVVAFPSMLEKHSDYFFCVTAIAKGLLDHRCSGFDHALAFGRVESELCIRCRNAFGLTWPIG